MTQSFQPIQATSGTVYWQKETLSQSLLVIICSLVTIQWIVWIHVHGAHCQRQTSSVTHHLFIGLHYLPDLAGAIVKAQLTTVGISPCTIRTIYVICNLDALVPLDISSYFPVYFGWFMPGIIVPHPCPYHISKFFLIVIDINSWRNCSSECLFRKVVKFNPICQAQFWGLVPNSVN